MPIKPTATTQADMAKTTNATSLDSSSTWYGEMLKTKMDQTNAEARLQQLEKEMEALKVIMGIEKNRIEEAKDSRSHAAIAGSKAECLFLASKMKAKLPRELRDLVYEHCVRGIYLDLRYPLPKHPLSWKEVHPILLPDFVGLAIAQEAAQIYFEKYLAFYTLHPELLAWVLEVALQIDFFGSGMVAHPHLRSIYLCVKSETWCISHVRGRSLFDHEPRVKPTDYVSTLLPLLLKTKGNITIELSRDLWDSFKVLQDLHPVFTGLRAAGMTVTILYAGRNLTKLFDLPAAEREFRCRESIETIDVEDFSASTLGRLSISDDDFII